MKNKAYRSLQWAGTGALAMAIAGCAVSPEPLKTETLAEHAAADRAALANDQPPITGELTPQQAIARAILYNRDKRVAEMKAALAHTKLSAANYDMLPSLTAQAGYTTRSEYSATESVPFIDGEPRSELSSGAYSIAQEKDRESYGIDFTWSVLDFGLSYVKAKQQANRYLISVEDERKAIQNLAQQTRAAYWKAVSANRLLDKVGPLMARVDDALANSRQISRQRISDPLNNYSYERSLLDVKRSLQSLRNELIGSKEKLAQLMGLPPDTAIELPSYDTDALTAPHLALGLPTMENTALLMRPEVRQASYKQRIARDDVKASLLQMFPDLSFSAGYQYDSNSFLRYNDWASAGASLSYDLLNIFQTRAKHEAAKTEVQIAKEQRMATALAVLTQVHLATLQFQNATERLDTAKHYLSVSRNISDLVTNQANAGSVGQLTAIKEQLNSLVAELRRDLSYAEIQNAYARIYQSIGLNPYPARDDETPDQLANAIENRMTAWQAGQIGVVVLPIAKQHPVLARDQNDGERRFTFADHTFAVAGDVSYEASSQGGALPAWLHFDPARRTFSADADAPVQDVPITLVATNDHGVSGMDTFVLKSG